MKHDLNATCIKILFVFTFLMFFTIVKVMFMELYRHLYQQHFDKYVRISQYETN